MSEQRLNKDVIQIIHSFLINRKFMLLHAFDELQADAAYLEYSYEDSRTVQGILHRVYERFLDRGYDSIHLSKLSHLHYRYDPP